MMRNRLERLLLTREALISVSNLYPADEVFVYPAMDVLHLYIQRPVALTFVQLRPSTRRPSIVFSSFRDPEFRDSLERTLRTSPQTLRPAKLREAGEYGLVVHSTTSDERGMRFRFDFRATQQMDALFRAIGKSRRGEAVLDWVHDSLDKLRSDQPTNHISRYLTESSPSDLAELGDLELDELTAPLRRVVDDAFADVLEVPLLRDLGRGRLPFSNLFSVVRVAAPTRLRREQYPYTARVVLADGQREQIRQHYAAQRRRLDADAVCDDLELPLGQGARSIADSVFASGVIDFSSERTGEGRDDPGLGGHSTMDRRRQAAEARVYGLISDTRNVFMVPIHVSGTPWFALFCLAPRQEEGTDDSSQWMHNFHIYRTLIPGIAGRLRVGTKRSYLQALTSSLIAELDVGDEATAVRRINHSWRRLNSVYPFGVIGISDREVHGTSAERLQLPNGRQLWLGFDDTHPIFERHVKYDILNVTEIVQECRNALQRYRETAFLRLSATQRQMSYMIAHDVRGTLDHAVVDPLLRALDLTREPRVATQLTEVIERTHHVRSNLRFWLDAVVDLEGSAYTPQSIWLDRSLLDSVLQPESLSLQQLGPLPNITAEYRGPGGNVRLSQKTLTSLFRIIIENAVIAMSKRRLLPAGELIRVSAVGRRDRRACRFSVWNSGTHFPRDVQNEAGHRTYQSGSSRYGSGLGFVILERILQVAGARQVKGNRHFELRNTQTPFGAGVHFTIPLLES